MMMNQQFRPGRRMRLFRGNSAGQALVELALTIPLLLLVLLGATELARVAYVVIEVTNAAEAAVRYGAQNTTTAADLAGMQAAARADGASIALNVVNVTSTCGCADGSAEGDSCGVGGYSCASGAAAVQTLHATTSKSFDPLIHLPGLPTTFTLFGHANQKVLY